ncbi:UNVERIFIED_CONTAM: Chitinase 1 [Siphonaria sp. JEL0065]|nr:Chitinase 1 [Siphonaria sp. JEL0065]
MHILAIIVTAATVFASPIEKRQPACTFGAHQCSGQALQQCVYGSGSVLGGGPLSKPVGLEHIVPLRLEDTSVACLIAETILIDELYLVNYKTSTTTTTTAKQSNTTFQTSTTTTTAVKQWTTMTTTATASPTGNPTRRYEIVSYWGAHPTGGELPLRQYCDTNGIRIGASVGGYVGSVGLGVGKGKTVATDLWNSYLGGSKPLASRALPGVVLDGIDLDIESSDGSTNAGYAELADELRSLIVTSGKNYYISAAPQCPIPDASMDYTLKNGWFDFVSVQFCALCGLAFNGPQQGPNYADNSSVWNHGQGSWMAQAALWPNKNVKLVVGFPANQNGGNFGANDPLPYVKSLVPGWRALNPNLFGGLMWWDCFWMGLTAGAPYVNFLASLT